MHFVHFAYDVNPVEAGPTGWSRDPVSPSPQGGDRVPEEPPGQRPTKVHYPAIDLGEESNFDVRDVKKNVRIFARTTG